MKFSKHPITIIVPEDGLRVIEVSNWNGQILTASKNKVSSLLKRPESHQRCLYFLVGREDTSLKLYIGRTEDLKRRLKNHHKKDFWNEILICTGDKLDLNGIGFLEAYFIRKLKDTDFLVNDQKELTIPELPESQKVSIEEYADYIEYVLNNIGYVDLLYEPKVTDENELLGKVFTSEIKGVIASMLIKQQDFVILKSSYLHPESQKVEKIKINLKKVLNYREKLKQEGSIIMKNGDLFLLKDIRFPSAYQAALFVYGKEATPKTFWNYKGKTFGEYEKDLYKDYRQKPLF